MVHVERSEDKLDGNHCKVPSKASVNQNPPGETVDKIVASLSCGYRHVPSPGAVRLLNKSEL